LLSRFNRNKIRLYLVYSGMGGVFLKRLAVNIWTVVFLIALFFTGAAIADPEFPHEFLLKTNKLIDWSRANIPILLKQVKKLIQNVKLPCNLECICGIMYL